MTMSPGGPGPTDPAQGSAVPPYEGRRQTADEQPAAESGGPDPGEASVRPAHSTGVTRGEGVSEDQHDQGGPERAAGKPG